MRNLIPIALSILLLMCTNLFAQFENIPVNGLTNLEYKNFKSTWGDLNNDGFNDVILINTNDQSVKLLYGSENNGFDEANNIDFLNRTTTFSNAILADFNNDGYLDIFFTTSGDSSIPEYDPNILYRNNGDGTFTDVTEGQMATDRSYSISGSWGDINNDGYLDLFVSNISFFIGEENFLYLNNGDETFRKITDQPIVSGEYTSTSSHWIDINNDHFLDLIVLNTNFTNEVFINNQDLTFTQNSDNKLAGTVEESYNIMIWLDINLDGSLDPILFDGNKTNINKTFLNNNDGTFTLKDENSFPNTYFLSNVKTEDLNNDGYMDIVMASTAEENYIFYGNNFEEFERDANINLSNGLSQSTDVHIIDLNNDGFLDIHFSALGFDSESNEDDQDFIFQNSANENKWNRFTLVGTESNSFGVGSRILSYKEGEIVGHQQVVANGSINSNQFSQFGHSQFSKIDSITIDWMGGGTQVIRNLRTNLISNLNQDQAYTTPEPPQCELLNVTDSTIEVQLTNFVEERAVLEISENGTDFNIADTITNGQSYLFGDLNENSDYYIKVFSIDDLQFSFDSEILSVKTNLNNPEIIDVYATHNAIEILWTDNTEFEDNYLISLVADGIETEYMAAKESESFTIENLSENTNYTLRVKATSEEGNSSNFSNEIDILTLLNPPSNLETILLDSSIGISWEDNSSFSSGFELHRSLTTDFQNSEIITSENEEYVDTDANTDITTVYFYKVKAVNDQNESEFNEDISSIVTSNKPQSNIVFQYLNPIENILQVKGLPDVVKTFRIYKMNGRLALEEKTTDNKINISHLRSQLYIVKIQMGNQSIDFKILKKD